MKLARRFLAATLHAAAERMEPKPDVTPWPFGLGFGGALLTAGAIWLVKVHTDRAHAKITAVQENFNLALGLHVAGLTRELATLAKRLDALEARGQGSSPG